MAVRGGRGPDSVFSGERTLKVQPELSLDLADDQADTDVVAVVEGKVLVSIS